VYLSIFPTPRGNPLVIVDGIKKLLPSIQQNLPPGMDVVINYERARFIQASIDEVMKTLLEAVLIVVLVIWLCLGSLRSVIIAVVAIPLSMLGAAALMFAFGMSINLLTLLALVLAIGLVVDDAIVVVENVHRHIEEGKTPVVAALIGAREIFAAVIAMDLTLAAVYVPIGLMGGLTGALFREFALTLAGAVVISGIVALTLSPVMASLLLKSGHPGAIERMANGFFGALAGVYGRVLNVSLRQRWLTGGFALLVCVSLPFLYSLPQRELAPPEDQAAILMSIKSPQHVSLDYAERVGDQWHRLMQRVPEADMTWIINGTGTPSSSFGGINLSDWGERTRGEGQIKAELQQMVSEIEGSDIFVFQVAPLPGGSGGLPIQLVLRTAQGYPVLFEAMEELKASARQSGLFWVVDSDLDYNSPVVQVTIDRSKAASLGISMQAIGDSLSVLLDEGYINRFTLFDRSYDVITQSTGEQRLSAQSLARQFVRSETGTLVPLSTLVKLDMQVEPNHLNQFNQQNSATLQAIPKGSMGEAVAFLQEAASKLPSGFSHDWQAESRQYVQEGSALVFAFLAALVVIYLVLTAQYESLVDPLIILITVPLSICGALVPLALGWATLNIYTQIGLVTLIGLISKHGILMVAFANTMQVSENLDRRAAIVRAAQIRLRPILMTTGAMAFGVLPLLFANGAGAASRFGLGLVLVCGMLVGTLFTLFVLPTIYSFLARDHRVHSERQKALAEIDLQEGRPA